MSVDFNDLTGRILKGYELRQLLGRGGFGAVYRAYQASIDREVAIKVILPEYANHPNFIRRFETEAQVVARLDHIHIVPLFDYWREPDTACLVMRLLRGGSLQDSIDRNGAWDVKAAGKLLDQIASALALAHLNGIIHRDIKPANIMLDEYNNAYLGDFGIAKNLTTDPTINAEEDRFGSPAYISPEQVTGDSVSAQTDIYSLGIVLYMLLTGRTPFVDPSTTTVIRKQLRENLPALQTIRSDLPIALNMVIWRATAKMPRDRHTDALSLAADFRRAVDSPSLVVQPMPAPSGPRAMFSAAGQTLPLDMPLEPQNPYKGLRPFEENDAQDFFGRSKLVERLAQRLMETEAGARFLAVVGPSGSGKSSVVKAGLLPALQQGIVQGSKDWFVEQMTPGAQPFTALEAAILGSARITPEHLTEQLRAGERGLLEAVNQLLPEGDDDLLLIIDQFEELFTLTQDEAERALFLKNLLSAITAEESRVRVIITLRADFYDRPLLYPEFGDLIRRRTEIILPLSTPEMEQAILGPAERVGMRFEAGLVAAIIGDINQQPGGLPLLQFALTELFEQREGYQLTNAGYQKSGGALGALARRADEIYEALDEKGQAAARQLFLHLVTPGDNAEDTKRRALQPDLWQSASDAKTLQLVIDQFSRQRLLTTDHEPATRTPTVEIAHEALIRVWKRLRDWLNESRDELRLHQRLSTATRDWLDTQRDPSYLARGAQLVQFESLKQTQTFPLDPEQVNYLNASINARQKVTQRLRAFVVGLIIFSVAALALALFAIDRQQAAEAESDRADVQASISRSRELAVTALTGVRQTDLALLLSLEALQAADTFEARNSLLSQLQAHPYISQYWPDASNPLRTVAVSPDGKSVVAGGADGTLIRWDAAIGEHTVLSGHSDRINAVVFMPDGSLIASGSSDGTVRLWDATTGEPFDEPLKGNAAVWSLAVSPEGSLLASGGDDSVITLWNTETGEPVGNQLTGIEDTVFALAFSPDGKMLVSGGGDSRIHRWDVTTRQAIGEPLEGHTNWVLSLAFNPVSNLLASTGADARVIFWDVESGETLAQLPTGHRDWVRNIAFSADGKLFATASSDQTLYLWDADSGERIGDALTGHTDAVWGVTFAQSGQQIISAGADSKLISWNTQPAPALGKILAGHEDSILSVSFGPDGKLIASAGGNINSGGGDSGIHLWDTATGDLSQTLEGHQSFVTSVVFSPDGKLLASAGADQTIRIWDMQLGETLRTLSIPERTALISLAFSPDGKLLASGGGESGQVQVWNVASGASRGDSFEANRGGVLALAFSPNGQMLASAGYDGQVLLWNSATNENLNTLTGHRDVVTSLAFSPDGQFLASGSRDDTIRLWNVNTGEAVGQPLIGHEDYVTGVAFSPDGRVLASSSEDETMRLWDVERREPIGQPFIGHRDWVTTLAYSPDGSTLVTGGRNGSLIVWESGLSDWRARACKIANRNMSVQEWERYLPGIPYEAGCPAE